MMQHTGNAKISKLLGFLFCFIAVIVCHYQCAPKITHYLSQTSRNIHQEFWASELHIYGYLMRGTEYQTPIFHFDSGHEGPTVLILGGTHGNEPAGFEAAHRLLKELSNTGLKSGNVFIVPEANKVAIQEKSRRIPVPERMDKERGNLNRCYPGNPNGLPMEQEAYEIIKLVQEKSVNLLLDLHESPRFHLESKNKNGQYHGLGQTLIYSPNEEATWLGMVVIDQLNSTITSGLKKISLVEGPVKYSAAWFAGANFNIPGFTVETCKQLSLEERIRYQMEIVNIIFKEKGMF